MQRMQAIIIMRVMIIISIAEKHKGATHADGR